MINKTSEKVCPSWSTLVADKQRLRELSVVQGEYIKLLEDEMEKAAVFLDVHGWKYKRDIIEKGEELRTKITQLKKEVGFEKLPSTEKHYPSDHKELEENHD